MAWLRAFAWLTLASAATAAAGVTVSRLWPTHTYPTAILTSFTPLALVGYGASLLAIAILGRASWHTGWTLVTIAVLGATALHLIWLAPGFTGSVATDSGAPGFRLLTINAQRGAADDEQILAAVDELGIDVLVVEEITPELAQRLLDNGVMARFPHGSGEAKATFAGTVVFSKYPLRNERAVPTYFDSLVVTVDLPSGPIDLLAVHPVHPIRSAANWRREHALIRASARDADVVAGDFNATLDHQPMRSLGDDGFRSVAEIAGTGWAPTWPSNGRGRLPGPLAPRFLQIDHIMVREAWAVVDVRRVPIARTDHTGVYAEITRATPPAQASPNRAEASQTRREGSLSARRK